MEQETIGDLKGPPVMTEQMRRLVMTGAGKLPARIERIVRLRYQHLRTGDEIAEDTGEAVDRVLHTLHVGVELLVEQRNPSEDRPQEATTSTPAKARIRRGDPEPNPHYVGNAIRCAKCRSSQSHVIDSRGQNDFIRRRRECLQCRYRFTTYETVMNVPELLKLVRFIRRVQRQLQAQLTEISQPETEETRA